MKATLSKLPTSLWGTDRFSGVILSKLPTSLSGTDRFSGRQFYQSCLHHYGEMIDFQGKATIKVAYIIMGKSGDGNSIKVAYINMGK